MQPIAEHLVRDFASEFASGNKGFALKEITPYFGSFQAAVPTVASGPGTPTKPDHFCACVSALSPGNQRLALYALCDNPPIGNGIMPDQTLRANLLVRLAQADGVSPLGRDLSGVNIPSLRHDWFTAASRLEVSISGAVTAARTMLEAVCKTILDEHNITPQDRGDLARLYNQTRTCLGIVPTAGATQSIYEMCTGAAGVVSGLAGLSNASGDRHGLVGGAELSDRTFAGLAVHASGALCLFLAQTHLFRMRTRGPS